ncbi:hypothetical protein TMatcc_004661 [Talaromyces marneffei ATCC 18224]|uniref:Uncharacterized protein n=2 Tax=Talaromyces marneffei TaxID=37727 RepID=B6Q3F3_TALMQ|nr:uncharacterized protein EYB26_000409 [Talaromyces marneffei]EEA27059.1 conserved hypothetical protein [Talaromyces marneffei ATCC 18224]KAE8557218.1 hypothetical protein EYB25_001924 [Talaromyces marneffei]QGA12764.1 hypothetical protein EYB26_000409 [Talaromyces marneffei]
MHLKQHYFLGQDPSNIHFVRELTHSDASSVFEIEVDGETDVMKLFHDNGDPGYTEKGRDLNRFRCELNAYKNLQKFGVCEQGFVPYLYGHIERVDPAAFQPALHHFAHDEFKPVI